MTSATIWSMGSVRCDFFKNFVLRTRSSGRTTVCNRQTIYVCVFSFSIALQGLLIHLAAFTRACVTEIELQPVKRSKRGAAAKVDHFRSLLSNVWSRSLIDLRSFHRLQWNRAPKALRSLSGYLKFIRIINISTDFKSAKFLNLLGNRLQS